MLVGVADNTESGFSMLHWPTDYYLGVNIYLVHCTPILQSWWLALKAHLLRSQKVLEKLNSV